MAPRILACWAGAALGREARRMRWCTVDPAGSLCSDLECAPGRVSGNVLGDPVGRRKHPNRAPDHPIKVGRVIINGIHWISESSRSSRRAPMVSQPSLLGHFLSFVVQKLFSHPFIVSQKQLFSVQMYIQCGLRREGVQCLSTLPSSWTSPPSPSLEGVVLCRRETLSFNPVLPLHCLSNLCGHTNSLFYF